MTDTSPGPSWKDNSGAGPGAFHGWRYPLLLAPALAYRGLVALRLLFYRWGFLRTHRAGVAVISVGNLTVGGAGKTPVVDMLLGEALRAGRLPACLTRGYGRRSKSRIDRVLGRTTGNIGENTAGSGPGIHANPHTVGDEPAMLARRHPEVPIYVGAHRCESARLARIWDDVDLQVLDDGFQHLRLHRDLNVLLVDALRGLGNHKMLPLGPLREPLTALKRADVVLITKANLGGGEEEVEALRAWIARQVTPGTPVWRCDDRPTRLVRLDGKAEMDPRDLAGREVALLCAIAQPAGFVRVVADLGATVRSVQALPDHHAFQAAEVEALDKEAPPGERPAPLRLMTEKDAVKLRHRVAAPENLWVLEMGIDPEPAARTFFFDFIQSAALPSEP